MILSVELRNWRAYSDSVIDLSSPVVFFVAPNGVGKSSLVEAVRWCLLGEPSARKVSSAVRKGASLAQVTVELDLGEAVGELQVTRTLTSAGKTTFRTSNDLNEEAYLDLLSEAWSADKGLIDRLMFTDPHLAPTKSAFPVRDHLAATLGVTPLLDTARQLDQNRKELSESVASLRTHAETISSKLDEAVAAASTHEADLETVRAQRQDLAGELRAATTAAEVASAWVRYREQATAYNNAAETIAAELGSFLSISVEDPAQSIAAAKSETTSNLNSVREASVERDLHKARSATAAELLVAATDACPTCLRPLSDHERVAALTEHDATTTNADNDTDAAIALIAEANQRLELLGSFTARLAELPRPSIPTLEDPGPSAAERVDELRLADVALAEQAGALTAVIAAERNQVQSHKDLDLKKLELQQASHEEQLLITTIDVLNGLADKTLSDRLDPLITELSHRWKLLFGSDGLALEPNGDLIVRGQDGDLQIADLSGGERATAVLIARLLISASTTRVPTVWFDEPLEHLDPRRRAAVARTLVRAGQTKTVRQLIITTYEERIARQLAAADPENVRVVYADGGVQH